MTLPLPPAPLTRLVDANAPYWAAEALVCRTYFTSTTRTAETDRRWLARQAAKELIDGVWPRLRQLEAVAAGPETATDAARLVDLAEEVREEASHYEAFLDAHDRLGDEGATLDLAALEAAVRWPENVALREMRERHRAEHGVVGVRASDFTEGGYCVLFSEGLRLAGRGGADDLVAAACALVYDDEFDHMLNGIGGLGDATDIAPDDWTTMCELTVAQSRQRVLMRNAQLDEPVGEALLADLLDGRADPLVFDWERAGFATPRQDDR